MRFLKRANDYIYVVIRDGWIVEAWLCFGISLCASPYMKSLTWQAE